MQTVYFFYQKGSIEFYDVKTFELIQTLQTKGTYYEHVDESYELIIESDFNYCLKYDKWKRQFEEVPCDDEYKQQHFVNFRSISKSWSTLNGHFVFTEKKS